MKCDYVVCNSVRAVFVGILFTSPVGWLEVCSRQPKPVTMASISLFWIEPCVAIFSIPSVASPRVLAGRETPTPVSAPLQGKWHLPQQRRQVLRRVLSNVRPVQQRVVRHQLELFFRNDSCIHNSLIERCRTFPDPVLVHIPRVALLSDAMVTSDCIPICS